MGGGRGGLIVFFTQSSAGVALRFGLAERERLKQKQRGVSLPQGRMEEQSEQKHPTSQQHQHCAQLVFHDWMGADTYLSEEVFDKRFTDYFESAFKRFNCLMVSSDQMRSKFLLCFRFQPD